MANVSIVNWGSYLHPVEGHGARIKHQAGVVEYTSPLLPPGTNIYTWRSESRFQDTRMQGTLPILRGHHTYRLIDKLETIPEDSAYFRVTTYDRENHFVKEFILDASGGTFDYPAAARSYSISLVVKANHLIRFKWLAIGPADELAKVKLAVSDDLRISTVIPSKPQAVNIYVTKKGADSWQVPIQENSSQIIIRLTDDEIENGGTSGLALLDQVFKKYDLKHHQVRIRAYGYPLTSVIQAFRKRLSILKGERSLTMTNNTKKMTSYTNNQPMNFFVNRAMGIGNSGVEHAQFYRAKRFDQVNLPYKFLFVQLVKELHPAMDAWNLRNDQVISMYEYFVLGKDYLKHGVKNFYTPKTNTIVDGTNTNRMISTVTASGMQIVETAVKYPDRKKKGFLIVNVSTVEIYNYATGERKVLFDFYDNNKGGIVIRNIHLFDEEGQHLFFWSEVQMQRYFFKKVDQAYGGGNNWFLDRGEESEAALFYPRMPGSRLVEVVHADHLADRNDPRYPLWNNYYEYALTHVDRVEKVVSATHKQTEDLLIDFPGQEEKFATIPVGGVKDLPKAPKVDDSKRIPPLHLITASRLADEKHIDIVVRSVAKVRSEGVDVSLDIYGAGNQDKHIQDVIKTVGAGDYIKLKGLSHHLDQIYPKYDAFITASWSEGFGLTTVEALSAGLPVVAYDARFGSEEMIEDGVNGFLQPFKFGDDNLVFNVDQLANGIHRLLKADYPKMKRATYTSMTPYQDHIIAHKWEEFVHALRNN